MGGKKHKAVQKQRMEGKKHKAVQKQLERKRLRMCKSVKAKVVTHTKEDADGTCGQRVIEEQGKSLAASEAA